MKKAFLLFSLSFLCLSSLLIAQAPCGFDLLHKKLLARDPAYARIIEQNEVSMQRYISRHPELGRHTSRLEAPLFTIPVVVHVVHTGGAIGTIYNPTDAQIVGAINYLNQVYNGTFPGTIGVGDLQIQFALAQRDPNCNPTNGIDRVNGSGLTGYVTNGVNVNNTNGVDDVTLKNLSRWNTADYYNIWVVDKLDGADGTSGQFVAGYAYFAGAGPSVDGTVMLATQMTAGQKTLPHEIGHALNLYHVFEGSPDSLTCPANGSCSTQGDRCCDTDPIRFNQLGGVVNFACRTGVNPCGGNFSPNTEENYMNYTSCFNLFTADQKARVIAAMSLPSRASLATSLGATPTNSGATQCVPKINFELNADGVTEATVTTTGCRSYRDYTYNMTIGNDPTAAATATLAVMGGSTATEGVDFDITTNGNFAAPSKVVTFPAGVHTNRSFTIRIYDDAILDGSEIFTLNYTVNSGGGNAVAGNGNPTLAITITDNDLAPVVPGSPTNFTVGANQGSTVTTGPLRSNKLKHRMQMLFTAAELTSAGLTAGSISGLTIRVASKGSTKPYNGFTIAMANTAATQLNTGFIAPVFTQVYQSNFSSVVGSNTFAFGTGGGSSPTFSWNGTSNVVVQFCFDNEPGAADAAGDGVEATAAPLGTGIRASTYSDYTSGVITGCALGATFISDVRITATFTEGVVGNAVATTTVTSLSQYLGPNADVYFYTNTGQIMGRIANLTSFDYGCTQISIDRTGATSAQFWNNTTTNYLASKSFRVIPTNNTTTGHYQIYLYYTQAEVNGWQTATTQTLTNAKVVKVSNGAYVPDVTPAAPHLADVSSVNATNTAFGSDYVISGDFSSTGFSGFGVGIPGAASTLPITLLSFDGHKEKNTVKLDWKTASEFNNDHFEIETSKDNNNYYIIGTQKSQGNATTDQSYSFIDNLPAKGVNYYRLKQIDIDGKSTYSRIISVSFDGKINIVHAYPNPVKDKMVIELASPSSDVTFKVYTLEGKMIRQELHGYVQRSEILNIQNLSSGTYILQVQSGADIYTLKFVKQ